MATAIYITREELVRHTPLNGNIDMDKIIHFSKIAQDIHIQGFLGTRLYDKLNTDIIAGNLAGTYLNLVNKYLKPVVIHLTFLEFLPFSQYTISNNGVFKKTAESSTIPSVKEMDRMQDAARDTADHYVRRLIDHLTFESGKGTYPEYNLITSNSDEMQPQKDISFGGWQI